MADPLPLSTCPFCGGKAHFLDTSEVTNEGGIVVECKKCLASTAVVFAVKDDPRPHAALLWNSRAALTAPPVEQPAGSDECAAWKALQEIQALRLNPYCAMELSPSNEAARAFQAGRVNTIVNHALVHPCLSPLDPRIAEGLAREKANGEFMRKQDEVIAKLREEIRALEIRRP